MSVWYELRLKPGVKPSEIYETIEPFCLRFHHFWDEPWWPGAYVVRALSADSCRFELDEYVDSEVVWDAGEDEQLYGDDWRDVSQFFEIASRLALRDERFAAKLVHCFLNARGMDPMDEARFAARLLWNRLTIEFRWHLYLRRRWERQRSREVAS